MGVATKFGEQRLTGFYLTNQEQKDITQSYMKSLYLSKKADVFITTEEGRNGIKQFLQTGLLSIKDMEKTPTVDNMFNAELMPLVDHTIWTEFKKRVFVETPIEQLEYVFTTAKGMAEFKRRSVDAVTSTIEAHIYKAKIKSLLLGYLPGKQTKADRTIAFENPITIANFKTAANVKEVLTQLRTRLNRLRTHTDQHTKFSRNNPAYRLEGSFNLDELYVLVNTQYDSAMRKEFADIFNFQQLITEGLNVEVFDFDMIERKDFDGVNYTKAMRQAINKTAMIVFHKDMIKFIKPQGGDSMIEDRRNNDHAHLLSVITQYGAGYLPYLPAFKVTVNEAMNPIP